jgi:enoyl-CoA hydratase/carnithine racemase
MRTEFETLLIEVATGGVTTITLNRPDALNAMNTQMMRDLRDCFMQYYVDDSAARCLILTGSGARGFCTGADLKERRGMTDAAWRQQHAVIEQAIKAMMDCPIPIMAAVNGATYAGGLELALACDFVYAADHAKFALTEVTLGIMPGAAGTQNLPRAVGQRRAKEIILTGSPFSAQQALEWGVANKIMPGSELMTEVLAVAHKIAANAPISVKQAKKAIDKATELDRHSGYAFELEAYNRTVPTEDRQEGITAFNEKRKPQYKGK